MCTCANHRGAHGLRRKLHVHLTQTRWSCSAPRADIGKTERVGGLRGDNIQSPRPESAMISGVTPAGSKPVCINACASGESAPHHFDNQFRHPAVTAPIARRSANGRQCLGRSTHPQSSAPVYERLNHAPLAVGFQQATADVGAGSAMIFPHRTGRSLRCHRRCRYSVPDTAVVQKGFAPRHRDRRSRIRDVPARWRRQNRPATESATAGRALRVFGHR